MELTILDTETTGLGAPSGVVEIAWLRLDNDLNVVSEFRSLVNPQRDIEPGAFAIHGISQADVADAPTMAQIAADIDWPINICGHNCSFDVRMIHPYIVPASKLCTLSLARQYLKTSNHKLSTLKQELGLSNQVSHSALGDCYTTLELLKHILPLTGRTLEQIVVASNTPRVVSTMPFGKFKGTKMIQVPAAYRAWLLEQPELPAELRYTLELYRNI